MAFPFNKIKEYWEAEGKKNGAVSCGRKIYSVKDIKNARDIVPAIFATITNQPRYLPELKWNKNFWTQNIFRAYEAIFYRRFGARAEMSAWVEDGKVYYKAHTFEASIALIEQAIRKLLEMKWIPERLWIPQIVPANGFPMLKGPFIFAIAYDTALNGGLATSGGTLSFDITQTGSDLICTAGFWGNGGDQNITPTYGGSSMTNLGHVYQSDATVGFSFSWKLATSGTHTLAGSAGGSNATRAVALSASGANNVNNYVGTTTHNQSTTSVSVSSATGNLVNDFFYSTSSTGTSSQTNRVSSGPMRISTASGSSSVTMSYTSTSGDNALIAASIVGGAQITTPTVTTGSASDVALTSITGNGNITATGGENCSRRGFCYKQGTSGDPTTSDSTAYDDGSYGTGAYTKSITGLSAGTSYRVRAYAVNSAGTSYGSTVQVLTIYDKVISATPKATAKSVKSSSKSSKATSKATASSIKNVYITFSAQSKATATSIENIIKAVSILASVVATSSLEALKISLCIVTASISGIASLGPKIVSKIATANVEATAIKENIFVKIITSSISATATAIKSISKSMSIGAEITIILYKSADKAISSSISTTSYILRELSKNATASVIAIATITPSRIKEITASIIASVSTSKSIEKVILALPVARVKIIDMFYKLKYLFQNDDYRKKY